MLFNAPHINFSRPFWRQQLESITANIGALQNTCENLTFEYGDLRDVAGARLQRMDSRMDTSENTGEEIEGGRPTVPGRNCENVG